MEPSFVWDPVKEIIDRRKHGISFETAALVFLDPLAIIEQNRVVNGEDRWQTLGRVNGLLLLLVAHTVHENDTNSSGVIRIISAREADR